jgi:Holliday junction resolvase-like predicted endonuclease
MADAPRIDWKSARVSPLDHSLSVGFEGDAPAHWLHEFAFVVVRRNREVRSGWGKIDLHDDDRMEIHVSEVEEGSEQDLKYALDALVRQATERLAREAEDKARLEQEVEQWRADSKRMTERFRSS